MQNLNLNFKILRGVIPILFFIIILIGWITSGYIFTDTTFIIGILMLPYLIIIKSKNQTGWLYLILTIISLIGSIYLPTRTLHFFTLAFAALAYIEWQYGRLNLLPMFAVILMSSLVTNFSLVFSFPIRLKISTLAAKGLSIFDPKTFADGNIIHFRGTDFSVDTACMGLTMLQMSLLLALFLMAYFERIPFVSRNESFNLESNIFNSRYIFTPLSIMAILGITLGLNMFFNLLRIILLVLFGWMPDTFMHDAAGVVGLGLYVFLPLYFIVKKGASILNNSRFNNSINTFPKVKNFWKGVIPFKFINSFKYSFTILTLIWLTYISFYKIHNIAPNNTSNELTINYLEKTKCPKTLSKDGILKYENDEILAYLKPIPGFYAAEHSPLICWQGSGYTFGQVKSMLINDIEIYTGVLKKREDTLQTAWWYDNGKTQTASQTAWRTAILKGEPNFNLVNITSIDTATLYKNIKLILKNN